MAKSGQPVRDEEECRLLAVAKACLSEESAAANALSQPSHSLVYSEYKRLLEALKTLRLKSQQSRIALRGHKHKMREERQDAQFLK